MVLIYNKNTLTGLENEMELPGDDESRYYNWLAMDRQKRPFVQDAFPDLTATQREFLITGMSEAEQNELFSRFDDDSDEDDAEDEFVMNDGKPF